MLIHFLGWYKKHSATVFELEDTNLSIWNTRTSPTFNLNKNQSILFEILIYWHLSFILNFRLPVIFTLHLQINENKWNVWLEILARWAVRLNWQIFECRIRGTESYWAIWLQNQGCKRVLWRRQNERLSLAPLHTVQKVCGLLSSK